MTYEQALAYLTEHGQEHLLRYYDQLTPEQQAHLLEQIEGLQRERPQFQEPGCRCTKAWQLCAPGCGDAGTDR